MITRRQKQILDFITEYTKRHEFAPSLEEIKKHFKLRSVATVHEHVTALHDKGYLHKTKNQPRGISLVEKTSNLVKIPLLGTIAAGSPIEAIRNPEPLEIPSNMLSKGANHYALKISGTSMIEEGISDGDIVIVREQQTVDDGEKAVAYLPDKDAVTLKKIYRNKNRVKLVPANTTMRPLHEKNVEIQGKVIGVLRKEV